VKRCKKTQRGQRRKARPGGVKVHALSYARNGRKFHKNEPVGGNGIRNRGLC
jgi:hypothetical protein